MGDILNYFDVTDGTDKKVICKTCKKLLNSSKKSNLKAHLKQQHKIEFSKNQTNSNAIQKKTKVIKAKIEVNKNEIVRSFVGLVTENGAPFELLNCENMRNILKPVCSALSSDGDRMFCLNGDNAKKVLADTVGKLRILIKNELTNNLFAIKIDSATRLERSIFGISLQYCKDGQIVSRVIGMVELKGVGSSKSKNLANEIINVLNKYDLNLQQVVAITSDNGANMIKTTTLLSQCLSKYQEDDFLDNDQYSIVLEEIGNDTDFNCGEVAVCRCAAHTAQLVALDVMKNSEVKSFILQCRNFAKFLRKPSNRFIFELHKQRIPQIDCPTRWGSMYRMVLDVKSSRSIIENSDIASGISPEDCFEVNDTFWEYIEDFLVIFGPINDILIKFQAESLNYGDFYASWLTCKLKIKDIFGKAAENSFAKTIGESLLEHIEKRSEKLLNNDVLKACLYFDPRFQHTLSNEDKNTAIIFLKKIWDRFLSLNKDYVNNTNNFAEEGSNEDEDILTAFLRQDIMSNVEELNVYTQIEKLQLPFLKGDTNVLKYWMQRSASDPELYIISNIIFGVPPTQVTIERAFSSLRIILTESRNRLSHESLENIMLAKLNPSLLTDAIDEINFLQ